MTSLMLDAEAERLRAENRRLREDLATALAALAAIRLVANQCGEMTSQPRASADISESGQTPARGVQKASQESA